MNTKILSIFFSVFATMQILHAANIFPDLSEASDEQLSKSLRGAGSEFLIGCSLQVLSPYTPTINTSQYSRGESEVFSPKSVKVIGSVMFIDGAKEIFFCTSEYYKRIRKNSSLLKKGAMDLGFATTIYITSEYVPYILGASFSELGGPIALCTLYSFLSIRGLKDTCSALKNLAEEANTSNLTGYFWGFGQSIYNKVKRN